MPDAQRWRCAHPSHGETSSMIKLNVLVSPYSSCVCELLISKLPILDGVCVRLKLL